MCGLAIMHFSEGKRLFRKRTTSTCRFCSRPCRPKCRAVRGTRVRCVNVCNPCSICQCLLLYYDLMTMILLALYDSIVVAISTVIILCMFYHVFYRYILSMEFKIVLHCVVLLPSWANSYPSFLKNCGWGCDFSIYYIS